MKMHAVHLGALLLALAALNAQAEDVYRWKNAQGNTVISDRPPEDGVEYDVVSASTGRTLVAPPPPSASTEEQPEENSPPTQNAEQPREISQFSAPAKDPKLCEQARNNLRILEDGPRIRFTDDEGVVRFMSDDERSVEKDKTLDAIEAYCN